MGDTSALLLCDHTVPSHDIFHQQLTSYQEPPHSQTCRCWPTVAECRPADPCQCACKRQHGSTCRFAAVVELEMALHGNPDKKLLMRALARRRDNKFDSFFDHLMTELFITGLPLTSAVCAPFPVFSTRIPSVLNVHAALSTPKFFVCTFYKRL